MAERFDIEIDWRDVMTMLQEQLSTAQRDVAMRYAQVEALKRKNKELQEKLDAKADPPAGN